MSNYAGPLYEVNFVIDDEILAAADSWLHEIVTAAHRIDGIKDVRTFESKRYEQGQTVRTCQFLLRDDELLDELSDNFFAEFDAEAMHRFGEQLTVHGRMLKEQQAPELVSNQNLACLNCATRLRGQYCGHCGQRSHNRLISIWQLTKEAFGDLFELDSRLWKTLVPLLTRPGQLTRDYLEGRRARYMPPFRTYLVLSVIFFVVAFFNPKDDLDLLFEPEPEPSAEELAEIQENARVAADEDQAQLDEALAKLKDLEAEGIIDKQVVTKFSDDGFNINLSGDSNDDFFGDCENARISDDDDLPDWIRTRFSDERVKKICENNKARGVENFKEAMIDKIPVALIVLLPLMAIVLKFLYPLSRRYFVEHLLFFVHFHAFFFLVLTVLMLFASLVGALAIDGVISTLVIVAVSFYVPVYLYKAMRHVYAQGHLITIPKYLMLLVAYSAGATITLIGALLVAVLSA